MNNSTNTNNDDITNKNSNTNYFMFMDDEFPPTKESLFINGNNIKLLNLIHSKGLKKVHYWLRPSQVIRYKRDKECQDCLFDTPIPTDVIQGELGSCWFIAALSALTLKSNLIDNFMTPNTLNPSGYYQVRLCRRGEWVVVNIDDYLPCDKKNQLVFTLGDRRQFGFPLIEKALAKLYGSYEAIAKGACAEGLQTLTGAPSEFGLCSICETAGGDPEKIWHKIMFSKEMGFIMTCLCYNFKLFFDIFEKNGLFNLHIYSILDAREFDDGNNRVRLMKLRNPWGQKEWKGDWSKYYNWPQNIKDQLDDEYLKDKKAKSNGCFWMSFEDFYKYFYDITISKIRTDWTESRHSSFFYDFSSQAEVYMITLNETETTSDFEIELFATGRKGQLFDRNNSVDIDLCLIICRINGPNNNNLTCVAFEHNIEYFINLTVKLEPGSYIVFATSLKAIYSLLNDDIDFDQPNYFSYNIVFHSQTPFRLNRTFLESDIVADLFHSVAQTSDRIKYELNEDIRKIIISRSCLHVILIENLSTSAVKVTLDISDSKNLDTSRIENKSEDYLNPHQKQLIAFLTPSNYKRRFLISYNINTEYTQIFPENKFSNKPPINELFKGLHAIKT